jgi:hypothetical protein
VRPFLEYRAPLPETQTQTQTQTQTHLFKVNYLARKTAQTQTWNSALGLRLRLWAGVQVRSNLGGACAVAPCQRRLASVYVAVIYVT